MNLQLSIKTAKEQSVVFRDPGCLIMEDLSSHRSSSFLGRCPLIYTGSSYANVFYFISTHASLLAIHRPTGVSSLLEDFADPSSQEPRCLSKDGLEHKLNSAFRNDHYYQ